MTEFNKIYNDFLLFMKNNEPTIDKTNKEVYDCIDCNGFNTIKNYTGNIICNNCGIIKGIDINDDLDNQYTGLTNGDNSALSHTGMFNNNVLYQSNFTTKVKGNNIVWNNFDHKERTLFKIFKKIDDCCRLHNIPKNVSEHSKILYTNVYNKKNTILKGNKGSRSDKLDGLVAACIYNSCKLYKINRSPLEISNIYGISKSSLSDGCNLFFELMNKEFDINNVTTYNDFIERYASFLNINDNELKIIHKICSKVQELNILDDTKPWTFVCVVIYFSSVIYNFDIDKKNIINICETTDATLNKYFLKLMNNVVDLIV